MSEINWKRVSALKVFAMVFYGMGLLGIFLVGIEVVTLVYPVNFLNGVITTIAFLVLVSLLVERIVTIAAE